MKEITMLSCTPKETVVFNKNPYVYGEEMEYCEGVTYRYAIEAGMYKVLLGYGFLYFTRDEFFKHFNQLQ